MCGREEGLIGSDTSDDGGSSTLQDDVALEDAIPGRGSGSEDRYKDNKLDIISRQLCKRTKRRNKPTSSVHDHAARPGVVVLIEALSVDELLSKNIASSKQHLIKVRKTQ